MLTSTRRERERRKTHDGEEPEQDIEYTTEMQTQIINGKHKKVAVKVPKNTVQKTTSNMIKKRDKEKEKRRAQRIEILAQKLLDLGIGENSFNVDEGDALPLPTYEELRETATNMVDNIPWKDLRPALVDEGVSDDSLPPISPEIATSKASSSKT